MKNTITIEKPLGLWLINGKKYLECDYIERVYFQLFINTKRNQENLKY